MDTGNTDMSQLARADIKPGGMFSDIVETGMAAYQHQRVRNLRLKKLGEWESVPGYVDVYAPRTLREEDLFEGGDTGGNTEGWEGTYATVEQSSEQKKHGSYSLKVYGTGIARKSGHSTTAGRSYQVTGWIYSASAGKTADPVLKLGSTAGGSDGGTFTPRVDDTWIPFSLFLKAAGTEIHLELDVEGTAYLDTLRYYELEREIKAGVEVADQASGDRFILYQDGTSLKRLDYDSGDGNGYENETPSTLTLPSGVTIGSMAVLKFFVHRGVIRITGASEPLWYGYIGEGLFPAAIELADTDDFESGTESWTGDGATVAQSAAQAQWGSNSLLVTQTALDGVGKKQYTLVSGKSYTFRAWARFKGGSGDMKIDCGSTDEGAEYGSQTISGGSGWQRVEIAFTAAGTALYVQFNPSVGYSSDEAYIDFVKLEKTDPVAAAGWVLAKAAVQNNAGEAVYNMVIHILNGTTTREISLEYFWIYEGNAYSLPQPLEKVISGARTINQDTERFCCLVAIPADTFDNDRIIGMGIISKWAAITGSSTVYTRHVAEMVYFKEDFEDVVFWHDNLYYANGAPSNEGLYVRETGTDIWYLQHGYMMPGNRIKLENENGTVEGEIMIIDENDDSDPDNPGDHFLWFKLDQEITDLVDDPMVSGSLPTTKITIQRRVFDGYSYTVDSTGISVTGKYLFWVTINAIGSTDYHDLTGIPSGIQAADQADLAPNYSHHCVVNNRAFIRSLVSGEEHLIRYSPEYQHDIFPPTYAIPIKSGITDAVRAVVNRDERVVILNRNYISQIQWGSGLSDYYQDIALDSHGLYSECGYLVIDDTLYFMEADDLYAFSGGKPVPLMTTDQQRRFYKQHVSSSSFIGYNKLDREIWLFLSGAIMVYQLDYGTWYERETDISPVCAFRDYENKMFAAAPGKFVTWNHSESTFDEYVGYWVQSRILNAGRPGDWKQAKLVELYAKGDSNILLRVSDPVLVAAGGAKSSQALTPNEDEVGYLTFRPNYLCKNAEVEIESEAPANDLAHVIREADVTIHVRTP